MSKQQQCISSKFGEETPGAYPSRWSAPELKERQSNISVYSRIFEEYTDADHFLEFTYKTASILLETKAASFVFALSLILPLIMIGVGISNLEECPLDRNIPVFVLVGGAIASLKLLQVLWKQYNRRRGPGEEEATDTHNGSIFMDVLTTLILIVWFVYGNHIIYRYRIPRFEQTTEDPEHWCTKNVYMLTIISVAYTYALVSLILFILLIVVCTVHFQNGRQAIQETDDAECT